MDKARIAILTAALAGAALGGSVLLGDAEAAGGVTVQLSADECAQIEKAWGGECKAHADARLARLVSDAESQIRASIAAGLSLLSEADLAAVRVKVDKAKADKAAAEVVE